MRQLIITVGLALLCGCETFTGARSTLARVTAYWPGEGSGEHASWNSLNGAIITTMKSAAPFRIKSSVFATTPCRGLSASL